MPIRRTPPLSLEGSREVREEMSRPPRVADTPERREFSELVREMRDLRKRLAAEEALAARD